MSEKGESGWDQSSNPAQQDANGKNLRNVESGWDEITITEEMDGLVGGRMYGI